MTPETACAYKKKPGKDFLPGAIKSISQLNL